MKELEFIHKATVKMLRFDDQLLKFRTLLMFRIQDMVECVKDVSISDQQILSIGHKSCGRFYPPSYTAPIVLRSCCSDPDFFTRVLPIAIGCLGLFYSEDNRKQVCDLAKECFHNCFVCCNYKGDDPPKTVVVVEVVRKFVYIGIQAEKLRESSIVRDDDDDEEDDYYSESDLRDILGSVYGLKKSFKFSTNGPTETYRLTQVKAPIRLLSYNEITSMYIDDEEEEEEEEEDECPICLEGFLQGQQIARTPCSHIFHKKCAFKWLLGRGSCPLCRSICKTPIIL